MISGSVSPKFAFGQVCSTPGAIRLLQQNKKRFSDFIWKHIHGDWGNQDPEDIQANEHALVHGGQLMSVYTLPSGHDVWVITEADRSVTTMCLPSEH